jgi:hypothetical protein
VGESGVDNSGTPVAIATKENTISTVEGGVFGGVATEDTFVFEDAEGAFAANGDRIEKMGRGITKGASAGTVVAE